MPQRLLLSLFGLSFAVHLVVPSGTVGDLSYDTGVVAASILAWAGVRAAPRGSGVRANRVLIASGLTASTVCDLAWTAYHWTGTLPTASPADVAYLAAYLLFATVLARPLVLGGSRRIEVDALLDAATVATMAVVLFWPLRIDEVVAHEGHSFTERSVLTAYPVADAVLLALVVRVLVSAHGRSGGRWILGSGVLCWVASNVAYWSLGGTGPAALDVGWMLGALLMSLATWHRTDDDSSDPVSEESGDGELRDRLSAPLVAKLCFAVLPLAVPPTVLMLEAGSPTSTPLLAPHLGMAVLLALAFVRTARLLHSESLSRAEVARRRRYFQKLADNSSDAVVLLDRSGAVLDSVHDAHAGSPGGLPPHADIRAWALNLDPADLERVGAGFAQVVDNPGETFVEEVLLRSPDDAELWLSARFTNLLHDPDVGGVVVSLSDVTARKQAEVELERARDAALEGSRAKSSFCGSPRIVEGFSMRLPGRGP
ncbi:hypothetical protein, partial [Nocardioides ferulae]|uniref:hypothetical protein n=1 Tax=Nocardioides ferulae TaxID=2340821 RepID=UPI0013DDF532